MRTIFLPALAYPSFGWIYDIQREHGRTWDWDKVLLSYHYWSPGYALKQLQERHDNPTDLPFYVFGDSGGFSVVTKGASIDPVAVMRWQLEWCHAGVILDRPPYGATGGQQFAGSAIDMLKQAREITVGNVKKALPTYLRQTQNFKWYGVLQGDNLEQIKYWHQGVRDAYPFDEEGEGWAIAPKPSTDMLAIARYCGFIRAQQIKNVHVLQVTSAKPVGLFTALCRLAGVEYLTFDSATATLYSANHKLVLPSPTDPCNFTAIQQFSRRGERNVENYMLSGACTCMGCQWLQRDYSILDRAHLPKYLIVHNYTLLNDLFSKIAEESTSNPLDVLDWAAGNRKGPILREWENMGLRASVNTARTSILNYL